MPDLLLMIKNMSKKLGTFKRMDCTKCTLASFIILNRQKGENDRMDQGEESEKRGIQTDSPSINGEETSDGGSSHKLPGSRPDGFNLECAVCVYYEILRSLKPEERLKFFKITSLVEQIIIFQEFL